jgi:hypothetical protein
VKELKVRSALSFGTVVVGVVVAVGSNSGGASTVAVGHATTLSKCFWF